MLFKQVNLTFTLSLLLAALLFGVACDKTPDAALETSENVQNDQSSADQAPKASDNTESADQKSENSLQANTAMLRDQFQQEANATITSENAESVLAEIEKEINEELLEIEKEMPLTP